MIMFHITPTGNQAFCLGFRVDSKVLKGVQYTKKPLNSTMGIKRDFLNTCKSR